MPGWWIFALILFVIAALVFFGSLVFASHGEDKALGVGIAVIIGIVAVICTLVSAYDRVDTRNVGIITNFGRPDGVHGAGVVWHAPWKKVSELSEAIQLQTFESNSYDDAAKGQGSNNNPPAVLVRLANNSNAYVDLNLNWRLKEGAAPKLFQDYGGSNTDVFGQIKTNLVDRNAATILSHEFAGFNPQATTTAPPPNNGAFPGNAANPPTPSVPQVALVVPDLQAMQAKVKNDLQGSVGQEIEIIDVRIPRIFYDGPTQSRIDDYNKKVQETKNAEQDVATANARKQANDIIASSVQNPMTVVAQCMDTQMKEHQDPGRCWGPMGGVGGSGQQPLVTVPRP